MRAYAEEFEEDVEKWGITGLLHDFDYEKYPTLEDHPYKGVEILRGLGYPEDVCEAILGHSNHTGTIRLSDMAKTLYAVDELCGFLMACAYVRPDRKIANVELKSVKKKLKDKSFARAVNRDDIHQGIEELGVEKFDHIAFVIDALAEIADELGV
jgi:predicted hydrolase (HD superfamily)